MFGGWRSFLAVFVVFEVLLADETAISHHTKFWILHIYCKRLGPSVYLLAAGSFFSCICAFGSIIRI